MPLNATNGYRVGICLNQFLPQCLIEIVLDFLSTPVNLWDQKRQIHCHEFDGGLYKVDIKDLPMGDIISFKWDPEDINITTCTSLFAKLAEKLYPDEMKQVEKDLSEGHCWPYYMLHREKFIKHPIVQQIEKEGKIREYHYLCVQYSDDLYELSVKQSDQNKLKEIFDRNGFYF